MKGIYNNLSDRRKHVLAQLSVIVQFSCLGILLITGPWVANSLILFIFESIGILLGIYAIYSMHLHNLKISPEVRKDAEFINHGPYRYIRHPMYTAILATFIPLIISYPNLIRIVTGSILLIDLLFKLHFEERLLAEHFGEYTEYRKKTQKLFPFIY